MNAFPIHQLVQDRYDNYSLHCEGGLTKRELFAAMAMQGMLGSDVILQFSDRVAEVTEGFHRATWIAESATGFADALLAELAKDGAP